MGYIKRKTLRKPSHNYNGKYSYFITICTKNRKEFFGKIVNSQMNLTDIGETALQCWNEIPIHYPGTKLDNFVIMPDHIHGILHLEGVATHALSLQSEKRKYDRLPRVIGGFKSAVSKLIHQKFPDRNFKWQRSYNDKIIMNEYELENVRKYIIKNPSLIKN